MDFSYDNGTGPVDKNSPFMKYATRQQAVKRKILQRPLWQARN